MTTPPLEPDDTRLDAALRASCGLQAPPAQVLQRAVALFAAPATADAAPGALARLVARLAFDSASLGGLAFGVRGPGSAVRQLIYTVEGCDLDLRIQWAELPQQFSLSGQVFVPASSGTVALRPVAGGAGQQVPLDEYGQFRLQPVAAGRYQLSLQLPDRSVQLPPLDLPG